MEWYVICAILLIIILLIVLAGLLARMLVGQNCTVSIQQRRPNHELTQIQQEQERKKQKKFSSKLKRTFGSSSKAEQPVVPVEDVKTVEFSLKLGDKKKNSEELIANNQSAVRLLPQARVTQAELDAREKQRDQLRKKYNL